MKNLSRCFLAGVVLLLAAGCSTPASRITGHQAAFDAWPSDVREKVRAGHVDVGFTAEMVEVALGTADRKFTRTTATGASEVWVYNDSTPSFSIGIGVGGGGGHRSAAYGGGMMVGGDDFRDSEMMRIVFDGGRVVAIETRRR